MDKFCRHCGTKHTMMESPQKCDHCRRLTWENPLPVAVLLQPITDGRRTGVLIGQRTIAPKKGEWNLLGGYIDPADETVEHAALREFHEETGIQPMCLDGVTLRSSFSDGRHLLIFVESLLTMNIAGLDEFKANDECSAVRVAWEPELLCFESHTRALADYFRTNGA